MTQFFSSTFGFEEEVDDVYNNITCEETPDGSIITDKVNGKTWNAGIFTTPNITEIPKHEKRGNGKLNIIFGSGRFSKNMGLIDILESQSLPENDGATYLAASNFNCLEFVNSHCTARYGISGYPYDKTQGPYCAIACGPSILYRNYFVEVAPGKKGQLEKEVELLRDTPLIVEHGYVQLPSASQKEMKEKNFNWSDETKYRVGSHANCPVTMTRKNGGNFKILDGTQIAHHVYAAAFNFYSDVSRSPFTEEISKHMLTAEYKATILCAWDNSIRYPNHAGSNKLFLTLLGCGVFGNRVADIATIIASLKDLIVDSGLDVYIVSYDSKAYMKMKDILEVVVEETKGEVIKA